LDQINLPVFLNGIFASESKHGLTLNFSAAATANRRKIFQHQRDGVAVRPDIFLPAAASCASFLPTGGVVRVAGVEPTTFSFGG
jgi:hypothetical protein